jgi:arylsulfatase A-like enzyme
MPDFIRPNIIFVSAEQQRGDTLHCDGADWMRTPNLDRLAQESVLFQQAFSCAATCVSSRAAFYTALYPHNTGIYGFYRSSGRLHWLHRLREQGYHTTHIGKTHLPHDGWDESIAELGNKYQRIPDEGPRDWHKALYAAGCEPPLDLHETMPDYYDNLAAIEWPLPEELHPDVWVGDRAIEWLEGYTGGGDAEPFYLHVGFLSPHDLYDPPRRFLDMYDDADIPMPEVDEEELARIPDELWAETRRDETRHGVTIVKASHATPERIRRMRKHYYALITLVDEKLGQILEAVRRKGLWDNTIIIYTSDHGDHLFDHGLYYKGELYDTIVHIPLLIRAPDALQPGRKVQDLVSHVDVAQYVLDKAGAEGGDLDGISLAPVIEQGTRHTRQYAYAEEGATGLRPEPDLLAMIRSETHKLVYFSGGESGQLYDLVRDPRETRNLWGQKKTREVQADLTARLLDWLYRNQFKHRDLFIDAR